MMRVSASLVLLLALAACRQAEETGVPVAGEAAESVSTPAPAETAPGALDSSALDEREDPGRLLGYLAEAIGAGRWDDAALAWPPGGMTGARLKELLGNPRSGLVAFGKGRQEGAAGSLYYEAPMLLLGPDSQKEGTITLRRVNDVPGAEDWQLAWHVERLEWKD